MVEALVALGIIGLEGRQLPERGERVIPTPLHANRLGGDADDREPILYKFPSTGSVEKTLAPRDVVPLDDHCAVEVGGITGAHHEHSCAEGTLLCPLHLPAAVLGVFVGTRGKNELGGGALEEVFLLQATYRFDVLCHRTHR